MTLLRPWRLRPRWRGLVLLLLVRLLQRIQNAAACRRGYRGCRSGRLRLRRWRVSDDRTRLAVVACVPGEKQAGQEEAERQYRGRARQQVGGATARHETGTPADAETAAFGFLQQHGRDQRRNNHQVDYDGNSLHLYLPSQTRCQRPAAQGFAGFEVARVYTIGRGIVTPGHVSQP